MMKLGGALILTIGDHMLPASDHNLKGRAWAAGPTIVAPSRLARDETDGVRKAAKKGKSPGLGEGRR